MTYSNDKRELLVSQRRWVQGDADTKSHYETADVRVRFDRRYLIHYEPTQHSLIIKDAGGNVVAVYRDVMRMLSADVDEIEEDRDDTHHTSALP